MKKTRYQLIVQRTLNLRKLRSYRDWPWERFAGSEACLKWAFRDLQNLDGAIRLTKGKRCAVQAGGNLGIFPKRLAEEFERVITFEPDPGLCEKLRRNVPELNVIVKQAALGNLAGGVSLSAKRRDTSGRAAHEGLTHVTGSGKIPMITLDSLNLTDVDLLYLDIEGFEYRALQGAAETIARCRPVIGIEVNSSTTYYGVSRDELRDLVKSFSYQLVFRLNSDEVYVPC